MSEKLEQLIEKLLEFQMRQMKHDATGSPDNMPSHGPVGWNDQYGPYAWPGTTPEGTSALVRPRTLAQAMAQRMRPSNEMEPIRWTLTGQTDPSSCTNPDDSCGTPPSFGLEKACRQSREFGVAYFATREINRANLDQRTNIGDMDLSLLNDSTEQNPLLPMPDGATRMNPNSAVSKVIREAFTGFERSLARVLSEGDWTVAPAQTECGFVKEFYGIEPQIKTGHTDVLSGDACPAVDSIVEAWGQDIGDTAGGGDSRDFARFLGDIMFSLEENNRKFGALNAGWALIMVPRMWRELTNYWPCNFDTTRCKDAITTPNNDLVSINLDPTSREGMRLQMLRSLSIEVDGITYPVILDEGLTRTTVSEDNYSGTMLIAPMNLIDFEYKPMVGEEASTADGFAPGEFDVWNNGLWLVSRQRTHNCMYWTFTAKPRLHLRAPQLAAKITGIQFESRTEVRDYKPGESYYKDGGSFYTPDVFPTVSQ
jgi:hypothetical protein